MLGDSNAGKTSIINRYTRDQFTMTEPTIDISYRMKAQLTARGLISLQIWDTAGQVFILYEMSLSVQQTVLKSYIKTLNFVIDLLLIENF